MTTTGLPEYAQTGQALTDYGNSIANYSPSSYALPSYITDRGYTDTAVYTPTSTPTAYKSSVPLSSSVFPTTADYVLRSAEQSRGSSVNYGPLASGTLTTPSVGYDVETGGVVQDTSNIYSSLMDSAAFGSMPNSYQNRLTIEPTITMPDYTQTTFGMPEQAFNNYRGSSALTGSPIYGTDVATVGTGSLNTDGFVDKTSEFFSAISDMIIPPAGAEEILGASTNSLAGATAVYSEPLTSLDGISGNTIVDALTSGSLGMSEAKANDLAGSFLLGDYEEGSSEYQNMLIRVNQYQATMRDKSSVEAEPPEITTASKKTEVTTSEVPTSSETTELKIPETTVPEIPKDTKFDNWSDDDYSNYKALEESAAYVTEGYKGRSVSESVRAFLRKGSPSGSVELEQYKKASLVKNDPNASTEDIQLAESLMKDAAGVLQARDDRVSKTSKKAQEDQIMGSWTRATAMNDLADRQEHLTNIPATEVLEDTGGVAPVEVIDTETDSFKKMVTSARNLPTDSDKAEKIYKTGVDYVRGAARDVYAEIDEAYPAVNTEHATTRSAAQNQQLKKQVDMLDEGFRTGRYQTAKEAMRHVTIERGTGVSKSTAVEMTTYLTDVAKHFEQQKRITTATVAAKVIEPIGMDNYIASDVNAIPGYTFNKNTGGIDITDPLVAGNNREKLEAVILKGSQQYLQEHPEAYRAASRFLEQDGVADAVADVMMTSVDTGLNNDKNVYLNVRNNSVVAQDTAAPFKSLESLKTEGKQLIESGEIKTQEQLVLWRQQNEDALAQYKLNEQGKEMTSYNGSQTATMPVGIITSTQEEIMSLSSVLSDSLQNKQVQSVTGKVRAVEKTLYKGGKVNQETVMARIAADNPRANQDDPMVGADMSDTAGTIVRNTKRRDSVLEQDNLTVEEARAAVNACQESNDKALENLAQGLRVQHKDANGGIWEFLTGETTNGYGQTESNWQEALLPILGIGISLYSLYDVKAAREEEREYAKELQELSFQNQQTLAQQNFGYQTALAAQQIEGAIDLKHSSYSGPSFATTSTSLRNI